MKIGRLVIGIVIVLGIVAFSSFYIVEEGFQAIVTQFGRPIGEPKTVAGIYFKLPLIQKVQYFDKKILRWDGSPNQIPTSDKKYIWVDTTARWRIVDPLKFLQTVATERGALSRLDDILDSVVRDFVSANLLVELVRSKEWVFKPDAEQTGGVSSLDSEDRAEGADKPIQLGRLTITRQMIKAAQEFMPRFGILLVDIQIKRINYVDSVRQRVYERMIAERQRIAAQYRSEGEGRKAEILGQMQKELARIQSNAYRQALEIRGKGEAQATAIYGQAFGQDPDFFELYRSLELYRNYPNPDSILILSTKSEFFKYLKGTEAGKPPVAPAEPKGLAGKPGETKAP